MHHHHYYRPLAVRHGWAGLIVKDLETNPHTQYRVRLYGLIYWPVNFPA